MSAKRKSIDNGTDTNGNTIDGEKKRSISNTAAAAVDLLPIPSMMKALVKSTPTEGYDFKDIPVPVPGEGELLIKVARVSICGSDINLYKWNDVAKTIAALPFTPGHECSGYVAAIGAGVTDFKIGARIAVENHYYCGKCFQCNYKEKDLRHICSNMGQFGHGKKTPHGGFSQFTIVPARFAYQLKTDIDMKMACLLEPFGVAHHACEEVEVKGDTILITGCGPIGLCAIAVAKAMGATKIIATDVVEDKLATARSMGAHFTINSATTDVVTSVREQTDGDGVGALIECSGAPIFDAVFRSLRKGGRVLMLGLPKVPITVSTPLPDFIFKSITLKTIHGRKIFHTWMEAERMIADKLVNIEPIISHDLPIHSYDEAHRTLIAGNACKILVYPNEK